MMTKAISSLGNVKPLRSCSVVSGPGSFLRSALTSLHGEADRPLERIRAIDRLEESSEKRARLEEYLADWKRIQALCAKLGQNPDEWLERSRKIRAENEWIFPNLKLETSTQRTVDLYEFLVGPTVITFTEECTFPLERIRSGRKIYAGIRSTRSPRAESISELVDRGCVLRTCFLFRKRLGEVGAVKTAKN